MIPKFTREEQKRIIKMYGADYIGSSILVLNALYSIMRKATNTPKNYSQHSPHSSSEPAEQTDTDS